MARTGTIDLEVSNSSLGVNCGKASERQSLAQPSTKVGVGRAGRTYGKLPIDVNFSQWIAGYRLGESFIPTLELASVRLFKVVDFPLDGCPSCG